jgi:uncharacterized repeat protein (TIGR03803 family)
VARLSFPPRAIWGIGMRTHLLGTLILSVFTLTSCNSSATPYQPITPANTPTGSERVIYRFHTYDGKYPHAGLFNVNGRLWGTTTNGGASGCFHNGCGTIFAVNATGDPAKSERFRFSGSDGEQPFSELISVNGILWGTTSDAGKVCGTFTCKGGYGTVFGINPKTRAGPELYRFLGGLDGARPHGGLLLYKKLLYGTTLTGGTGCSATGGCGTVFELDPANGKERVIYRFHGEDGAHPEAGVIVVGGLLYGTTINGGNGCSPKGCGTVFAIHPTQRQEDVIYKFNGHDGAYPYGGLVEANGFLYGTTVNGGDNCGNAAGCGVVFSIDKNGKESILHRFAGPEGAYPYAGLMAANGTFYGTTLNGGKGCPPRGCGTVFSITAQGKQSDVFAFAGSNGAYPYASLIDVAGTLYGTTINGGDGCSAAVGCGTVFAVKP